MENRLPLYKKLLVMYRIEPGCLGPQGADYVEEFCVFAKQKLKAHHGHCLRWTIKYINVFITRWYESGYLDTGCTIHSINYCLLVTCILDQ